MVENGAIKPIDRSSVHRITSGQVVIDLQTAVKELVENSLDAGATNIEVRFKQYGLKSIEVIDNGSGIAEEYHDSIALKHHTSKLTSFADLATVRTFGFRGEALSSLCALSEMVTVATATEPPLGMSLEMEPSGKVHKRNKVARQRGTTVIVSNLFLPLPVRRKEFDRNAKREFGKALALLNAYALGPCCCGGAGVRLTVSNQADKGQKSVQLRTAGASSPRASVSVLWGSKALDSLVDLDLNFDVDRDKAILKRTNGSISDLDAVPVVVKGLISKFTVGGGRTGTDRQFFYVNGRPCNLTKIQKAFNEVYRSFNANQAPFILADFIIPTDSCDINVSPDKRTIFVHSEGNLITKLKAVLEASFAPSRSTYDVESTSQPMTQSTLSMRPSTQSKINAKPGPMVDDQVTKDAEADTVAEQLGDGAALSSPSLPLSQEDQVSPGTQSSTDTQPDAQTITPPSEPSSSQIDQLQTSDDPLHHSPTSHPKAIPDSDVNAEDQMDIGDTPPSQPAAATSSSIPEIQLVTEGRAVTVTVDTTTAAWNRPSQQLDLDGRHGEAEDAEDEDEDEQDDEGPVRKKRKSELGPVLGSRERGGSTNKSHPRAVSRGDDVGPLKGKRKSSDRSTARDVRGQLRGRLVGFARSGSQLKHVPQDVDDESDDEEGELDELMTSEPCAPREEDEEEDRGSGGEVEEAEDASAARQVTHRDGSTATNLGASSGDLRSPFSDIVHDEIREPLPGQSSSIASTIDLTSDEGFDDPDTSVLSLVEHTLSAPYREAAKPPEVLRSLGTKSGDITLRFDLPKITLTWTRDVDKIRPSSDPVPAPPSVVSLDASVANTEDHDKAADALARVIDKTDFADMEILGQFNLGFIIARRRKAVVPCETHGEEGVEAVRDMMDDLFIVDQHAADEKFNFETLQQTTNIQSQKLFQPQDMELTASDEMLAIENIDILRQNGFEIDMGAESDCQNGTRLKLTAQPISKSTVFGMKDLEELIHLMRDSPTGQMVRCSKARAMFAMRACRKSVMVGMPLNKQQMSLVVQHMGTMDLPWNCPHGRPTMRHLCDISGTRSHDFPKPIDWSTFNSE